MVVPLWAWGAFVGFILVMLTLDLFLFHREAHTVGTREGAWWTVFWVSLGLSFAVLMWAWQGGTAAGEYLAGYLIEWSLSVDNIFVFVLIFSYFALPSEYYHRVLFWGILGALVFRAVFITAGAALLHNFEWMIYVFGAFLVVTGVRMARHDDIEVHPEHNPVLRLARRAFPITPDYRGQRFFVRLDGRRWATPLFAILVVIETTDIIFAVDSIPAIFAVTRTPFIVFSSNAFAILGLRALFFLLAGMMRRFTYLKLGLSAVLVFVGVKMLLSGFYTIPIFISLAVIASTLTVSVLLSLRAEGRTPTDRPAPPG